MPPVDRFHRIPAEPEERRHLLDRQDGAQPRHALGQALGDPGVTAQPRQALQLRLASRAGHPPPRNPKPRPGVQDRQVTDLPRRNLVDIPHLGPAAIADQRTIRHRRQVDPHLGAGSRPPLNPRNTVPFPAAEPANIIIHRQRSLPRSNSDRLQSEYEQRYRCLLNLSRNPRMNLLFSVFLDHL